MRALKVFSLQSFFLLALLTLLGFLYLSQAPFKSVEFNLAELSPNGFLGGYAVPASSESSPPTVTLEVRNASESGSWTTSDITVDYGDETELKWSSSNTTSCTATAGSGFSTGNSTSGTDTSITEPSPGSSATYTVSCSGSGGSANDSIVITVRDNAPPSVTLEVQNTTDGGSWSGSNLTIDAGDSISLRWDSTYATTCLGGNFTTGGSADGTQTDVTEPILGETIQYTVSCTGGGGQASDSLSVTATGVGPSISCSPVVVRQGNSTTCSWNTNDALPENCSVSGPGINESPLTSGSGSQTATVSNESVFTIDCGVSGDAEVIIQVLPVIQET